VADRPKKAPLRALTLGLVVGRQLGPATFPKQLPNTQEYQTVISESVKARFLLFLILAVPFEAPNAMRLRTRP